MVQVRRGGILESGCRHCNAESDIGCYWTGPVACWIANFDEQEVKKATGIPDDWRIVAMPPLGYPAEKKESIRDIKRMEEIVIFQDP
jgi:nitroreductase